MMTKNDKLIPQKNKKTLDKKNEKDDISKYRISASFYGAVILIFRQYIKFMLRSSKLIYPTKYKLDLFFFARLFV